MAQHEKKSSARSEILGRIRRGTKGANPALRRQQIDQLLQSSRHGPQPALDRESGLVERFRLRVEMQASTVDHVAKMRDAPAAVARYLETNLLAGPVVATPDLQELDWSVAGIDARFRSACDADRVGITGCYCGIAETGTLMLLSDPAAPLTVSLLPETHIALIDVSRIVATMEEALALFRSERQEMPAAINFISGPSRTGDIEQTIVLGAHGPCRVHLILAEG